MNNSQVLRVGNRLLIILHLRLNTAEEQELREYVGGSLANPPKKRIIYHHKITYHQDLVVCCSMFVVGSNLWTSHPPMISNHQNILPKGLHIALNAIGLLPCKMILVAKCRHFMSMPWCAMPVSFPWYLLLKSSETTTKKNHQVTIIGSKLKN